MTTLPSISGRVPPHALDAEAAVLSTVLLYGERIDALDFLEPSHFYNESNATIFQTCRELRLANQPIDSVQVCERLRDREKLLQVGGAAYVAQIVDATPAAGHVEAHAKTIVMKWRRREMIRRGHEIVAEGYGDVGDEEEWLESAAQRVAAISEARFSAAETEPFYEPMRRVFTRYLSTTAHPTVDLITTGFPDLDHKVLLEPGSLVVVGARPGRGKSSLAMQMAMHVTDRHGDGIYFSAEMPSEQLMLRAACTLAKVDSGRIKRGVCSTTESEKVIDVYNQIARTSGWITDRAGLDIMAIKGVARREARRLAREDRRLRFVVIDYLQRIRAGRAADRTANREQQVAAIAREAKDLAMELGICVVVPAQLNADGDKRDDERPRVSDLRESKTIESEADVVLIVDNPFYLDRVDDPDHDMAIPEPCEIQVGKGRNDGNGLVYLWFTPMFSRFDSMVDSQKPDARKAIETRRGGLRKR